MSDLQKQLETALSRIAALEAANSRPAPTPAPQNQGIDPQQLARALAADPVGTMRQLGVPIDHVSRVMVAHTLGDQAPPELRMLAQQGPLVSATQAVAADLQSLRQRLDAYEQRDQRQARRQSFSALASDKTKYPILAAAYAKDPSLFEGELDTFQGDAAALADAIEGRLRVLAPVLGVTPPASTVDAEKNKQDQSSQVQQAHVGGVDPTPPPINSSQPGPFTQEAHEAAKARVLRKYQAE